MQQTVSRALGTQHEPVSLCAQELTLDQVGTGKHMGSVIGWWSRAWAWALACLCLGCVTLGNFPPLSGHQYPHLWYRENSRPCFLHFFCGDWMNQCMQSMMLQAHDDSMVSAALTCPIKCCRPREASRTTLFKLAITPPFLFVFLSIICPIYDMLTIYIEDLLCSRHCPGYCGSRSE